MHCHKTSVFYRSDSVTDRHTDQIDGGLRQVNSADEVYRQFTEITMETIYTSRNSVNSAVFLSSLSMLVCLRK